MRLAIVGCRNFFNKPLAFTVIDDIIEQIGEPNFIVSGGAVGADKIASDYADDRELNKIIYNAKWKKYGNKAGPMRNSLIVQASDVMIAFWNYKSPGTGDSITKAKEKKIRLFIVNVTDGKIEEVKYETAA